MRRLDFRTRRFITLFLFIILFYVIFQLFRAQTSLPANINVDRQANLEYIVNLINSGNKKYSKDGLGCTVPTLEVNAPEILSVLKDVPPIVCGDNLDWVEINGSVAKVTDWAKKKYGDVGCSFTDILRESDFKQHQGLTTSTHTEYNLVASDVVKVYCKAENGEVWTKVMSGIRSEQEIFDRVSWSKTPPDGLKLNVVIFGFDSMSHNMWKRKLPETYKYATVDLGGIPLNGYNIVGDGTPQALIPILTGKTELELPDTRKRMGSKAQYCNVYPFVWEDFRNNGYVTAWGEEMANVGTFTYRLKGFLEQPVDHYMRTFFIEAIPEFKNSKKFCYGSIPRHKILLNFIRDMYEVYKDRPKFVFSFLAELSHDNNNWIQNADGDTVEWLKEFHGKGHFNNTLLILMSDHGSRFADIRNSMQGKQEERLPGFIFIFPPWFEKKYPAAMENFRKNADRLTTPFDIYPTLKNVLWFEGAGKGDIRNRSISLFKEIPVERSCREAAIEPHWCTCLDWEELSVFNDMVEKAANYFVRYLNSFTSEYRYMCSELSLKTILWAAKLLPNQYIIKFKKNADIDGFIGDMSAKTEVNIETYQIKVLVNPGGMLFEASLRYHTVEDQFYVKMADISRINKYKHMTGCLQETMLQLRKFCYCSKGSTTA